MSESDILKLTHPRILPHEQMVNNHFYCAFYNTRKDRRHTTSNGDGSNDNNDNDNNDDNDNEETLMK